MLTYNVSRKIDCALPNAKDNVIINKRKKWFVDKGTLESLLWPLRRKAEYEKLQKTLGITSKIISFVGKECQLRLLG